MGFQLRKSFRILPGVRINLGLRSWSISVGPKGAHRTYSSTGRRTTSVDLPGPLSYRHTSRRKHR